MAEIQQNLPAHFDVGNLVLSRLDRIYTSIPHWALVQMNVGVRTCACPKNLFRKGVRDHVPVVARFSFGPPSDQSGLLLPHDVAPSEVFQRVHDSLVVAARLDEMQVVQRLDYHSRGGEDRS